MLFKYVTKLRDDARGHRHYQLTEEHEPGKLSAISLDRWSLATFYEAIGPLALQMGRLGTLKR